MKKKNRSRLYRWFLEVIPKGIAVFAVAAGAFYVYAQQTVNYPPQPYTPTGVVGQFVGVSERTYGGAGVSVSGYRDATTECSNTDNLEGSHVCTSMEIINSYNVNNSLVLAQAGSAWINNGPPAHDATLSNDCGGWQSQAATQFGSLWWFGSDDRGLLMSCNQTLYPFACCR